jgi:F-type H+-transporting ATPase subunit gamma
MELIAASQIARAQARIAANRPYNRGMARVVFEAARGDSIAAKNLLGIPENLKSVAVLAIVGDRGLAGAYNSSVLRTTDRLIAEHARNGVQVRLFTVGRKAISYFRFRGVEVEANFQGFADRPEFGDARDIASTVAAIFSSGEVDQVVVVSTRYLSSSSQAVDNRQLLPLPAPEEAEATEADDVVHGYTEFEPDPAELLADLAPRALESEIFTALLEGSASFHTAQQRAMAAATENADELVRNLTRTMNRARQDSITTEIMEIVGGAEALRQSKGA